jgi:hypothetical protein
MKKGSSRIIVIKSFIHPLEGSLAKSKLDAYGIPCFLSNENTANLYPLQNQRFSVRLHVFEEDADRAWQILNEDSAAQ